MGGKAQAGDWLGSHSSGTSKPQALTVSIPQSDRETRFDVWRERENEENEDGEGGRRGGLLLYYLMKPVRW